MIVYLARNRVNGKCYVGKTKRSLLERMKEHARFARLGSPQPFHRAVRKHGFEVFTWSELVNVNCTEDELSLLEVRFIAEMGTFGSAGYNATRGGDGVRGLKHTEDAKRRMGINRRGEKNHNFGKQWGRRGPWSEDSKQKMSESHLGLKHTQETKVKIATAQYVAVSQFDLSGNHLATYGSMLEAEQATGVGRTGISRCCRFPHRSSAGFRFQYAIAKE